MLPSPCGLRPQGRAATAPQWPLTCTIENQFVHKFFRISCKFHKYSDTILKNLETFRNNPRLTVQHVAKTSCNELQEHLWGTPPPYKGVCLFSKLTSCSDRRHRRAGVGVPRRLLSAATEVAAGGAHNGKRSARPHQALP